VQLIAVLDYGMGNLRSVSKAVEWVADGAAVEITADPARIREADRIICPGQGAARDCMTALDGAGLSTVIRDVIQTRPFLGICMGLQVLLSHSEENQGVDCLDIFPGQVRRFADPLIEDGHRLKVPHMGWSPVAQTQAHELWQGIADQTRFYFAHSYFVHPDEAQLTAAECCYGETFAVALARENVFATQFHPEKSADAGLQLLRNFTLWDGRGS